MDEQTRGSRRRRTWLAKGLASVVVLALVAVSLMLVTSREARAGPNTVSLNQLFRVEVKKLSGPADRLDLAFGKPDKAAKIAFVTAFSSDALTKGQPCIGFGIRTDHLNDVNQPPLINHEVWSVFFPSKCLREGDSVLVFAAPFDPSNHLVIKEATLYNTNGTAPFPLDDDVRVGAGNPKKLDWGKFPRFENLWLCADGAFQQCNSAILLQVLGQPVTSPDPKCTGFPNFQDPATCPRQQLGAFELEMRFDAKFVNVDLIALVRAEEDCLKTKGEGFIQLACLSKGKESPIFTPTILAAAIVTPKPDAFSILRANQENGIVTQLINQGCQLADLQGHPIPVEGLDVCQDGAVTLRFLEGDVHADCVVDVHDQQQIAFRWGSRLGQLLFNDRFDLEPAAPKKGDADIDAKDLQVVYGRHGSTCHEPHPAQAPVDPKAKVEPPPPTPE